MTSDVGAARLAKKQRKALKKAAQAGGVVKTKKIKQPKSKDAPREATGAPPVEEQQQPDAAKAAKRLAKAERKAAKRTAAAAAAAATAPADAAPAAAAAAAAAEPLEPPPKKRKKDKSSDSGAAAAKPAPQQLASLPKGVAEVGDAALAAAGKLIVKQLYTPPPELASLAPAQLAALRAERGTAVDGPAGACALAPLARFDQTGLDAALLHATRDFVAPSPIQAQCWPLVLSGFDLIGIAATGSGKTLAFGLPLLAHVAAQRAAGVVTGHGPFALVMAPTRELACQIAEVLEEAGARAGARTLCVYGGVPKPPQVAALRKGVEAVVGTPGRMEDLMQEGVLRLQAVTYLVLDEADRMLDLGFEPHIRAICSHVRCDRQTLMFSATWPAAVQKLASGFLAPGAAKVTVGAAELAASHSVTQVVEVIDPAARDARLLDLLSKHHSSRTNRIIIFVLYKKEAPRVEALLRRKGWAAQAVHGDATQAARTAAVDAFRAGTCPLLIATDVAARGLDIPDVELVINYSFPLTIEDYVHRIGRTGRAGKTGRAHTFFCAATDKLRAGELVNVLREAGQKVPEELLKFGTTVKKKEHKLYGAHFKDVDLNAKATKITFDDD